MDANVQSLLTSLAHESKVIAGLYRPPAYPVRWHTGDSAYINYCHGISMAQINSDGYSVRICRWNDGMVVTTVWAEDSTFSYELIEPRDGAALITCSGTACAEPVTENEANRVRRIFGVYGRKIEVLSCPIPRPEDLRRN